MAPLDLVSARETAESLRQLAGKGRPSTVALGIVSLTALWFVSAFALPYFSMDAGRLGIFEPRRDWLIAHIAGGIVALLLGPAQLWLAQKDGYRVLSGVLGILYALAVAVSSVAAFYLAAKTDFGWVFGLAFMGMASAWIVTTGLAVIAICLSMTQQHREWMIRSYVVTFAFVTFRILTEIFETARIGTITEQLTAGAWLSWSVPLLITEAILQGRKIFRRSEEVVRSQ